MQLQIPRINSTNYQRILAEARVAENRAGVVEDIKNVVSLMPHKSSIMSSLIGDLVADNADFKDRVVQMVEEIGVKDNAHELVSASLTLRRLGVGGLESLYRSGEVPTQGALQGISLNIGPDSLKKCRKVIEEMIETVGEASFEEVFCVTQVIKGFRFSVQECLSQLGFASSHKLVVDGLRVLHGEESGPYLWALAGELAKKQGFLRVLLADLPLFGREFRDTLLSLLFESFYNPGEENSVYISSSYTPFGSPEDLGVFKSLVTKDTERVMRRISDPNKVEKFLHGERGESSREVQRIDRAELESAGFENRKVFFRNFCHLGSPSISHFLTYLEIYKSHFVMTEEEQRLFLSIFFEVFDGLESFGRIAIGKMVRFGILDSSLAANFCRTLSL